MTREGRSSNSASALAASREPVSHNTDAAIVALADYAAREVIAEIRRDEEPLQDAPVVKLIVRLAAELRAEGQMLPQAVERLLPAARAHCPLVSFRRALSGMRRGLRRRKGAKRAAAQRAPEACPLYPPLEGVRGGT